LGWRYPTWRISAAAGHGRVGNGVRPRRHHGSGVRAEAGRLGPVGSSASGVTLRAGHRQRTGAADRHRRCERRGAAGEVRAGTGGGCGRFDDGPTNRAGGAVRVAHGGYPICRIWRWAWKRSTPPSGCGAACCGGAVRGGGSQGRLRWGAAVDPERDRDDGGAGHPHVRGRSRPICRCHSRHLVQRVYRAGGRSSGRAPRRCTRWAHIRPFGYVPMWRLLACSAAPPPGDCAGRRRDYGAWMVYKHGCRWRAEPAPSVSDPPLRGWSAVQLWE
jgi:hypothetical protein